MRALTRAEIANQLQLSQKRLVELRFKAATRQLRNTCEIGSLKRDIARMKTVLRELERGVEVSR